MFYYALIFNISVFFAISKALTGTNKSFMLHFIILQSGLNLKHGAVGRPV